MMSICQLRGLIHHEFSREWVFRIAFFPPGIKKIMYVVNLDNHKSLFR